MDQDLISISDDELSEVECGSDDEEIDFECDNEPIPVDELEDESDDADDEEDGDDGCLEKIPSLDGEDQVEVDGTKEDKGPIQYVKCAKCRKKFSIPKFLDIHKAHCSGEVDSDSRDGVSQKYLTDSYDLFRELLEKERDDEISNIGGPGKVGAILAGNLLEKVDEKSTEIIKSFALTLHDALVKLLNIYKKNKAGYKGMLPNYHKLRISDSLYENFLSMIQDLSIVGSQKGL